MAGVGGGNWNREGGWNGERVEGEGILGKEGKNMK